MNRLGWIVFCFFIAGALVMGGCATLKMCKTNPPGVTGCIPADCASCGPVGADHYRRS